MAPRSPSSPLPVHGEGSTLLSHPALRLPSLCRCTQSIFRALPRYLNLLTPQAKVQRRTVSVSPQGFNNTGGIMEEGLKTDPTSRGLRRKVTARSGVAIAIGTVVVASVATVGATTLSGHAISAGGGSAVSIPALGTAGDPSPKKGDGWINVDSWSWGQHKADPNREAREPEPGRSPSIHLASPGRSTMHHHPSTRPAPQGGSFRHLPSQPIRLRAKVLSKALQ